MTATVAMQAINLAKGRFQVCAVGSDGFAVVNNEGKPIVMALTAGQVSDHIGAWIMYPRLPNAATLIGDKGYDSDELRAALRAKGIASCIPL